MYSNLTDEFKILDFSATHNQLLIRSMRSRNRSHNIDIFFFSVNSLIIPATFKGIEISRVESTIDNSYLVSKNNFDIKYFKIYSLKDFEGKEYFINAGNVAIFHNDLDILESSIGRYYYGTLNEDIL
jgi:hypothetical protein